MKRGGYNTVANGRELLYIVYCQGVPIRELFKLELGGQVVKEPAMAYNIFKEVVPLPRIF